jgi:hypothetical protein
MRNGGGGDSRVIRECIDSEDAVTEWRTVSYGMLRRVALVRTHVSDELSASFIRVTRISELGTTLAVTSNRRTLRRNTKYIPEDTILHSHRRENLKSYTVAECFKSHRQRWDPCFSLDYVRSGGLHIFHGYPIIALHCMCSKRVECVTFNEVNRCEPH